MKWTNTAAKIPETEEHQKCISSPSSIKNVKVLTNTNTLNFTSLTNDTVPRNCKLSDPFNWTKNISVGRLSVGLGKRQLGGVISGFTADPQYFFNEVAGF